MKKLYVIIFIILIVGCLVWYGLYIYNNIYHIENDKTSLETELESYLNRGTDAISHVGNVSIKQMVDIENNKYVLFLTDTDFGYAEFFRGLNGKYNTGSAGHGNSLFSYRLISISETKYFFVFGKNYGMKIKYAKVKLDGREYTIDIPQQEYFIAYCSVSDEIKSGYPQAGDFRTYDVNNNDITDNIYNEYSY